FLEYRYLNHFPTKTNTLSSGAFITATCPPKELAKGVRIHSTSVLDFNVSYVALTSSTTISVSAKFNSGLFFNTNSELPSGNLIPTRLHCFSISWYVSHALVKPNN